MVSAEKRGRFAGRGNSEVATGRTGVARGVPAAVAVPERRSNRPSIASRPHRRMTSARRPRNHPAEMKSHFRVESLMTKTRPRKKRKVPHRSKRFPRGPHGGIELLLIQPVEHLGRQGDVVEVRPGYAYNYLLPQGLAAIATNHHKRMVEKHREQLAAVEQARLADFRATAELIQRQSITIEAKATDEGHLYGSVGPAEIAGALKRHNITIAQEQVRLAGPLKELGLYTITIRVGAEIDAELKIWVVPSVADDEPGKKE